VALDPVEADEMIDINALIERLRPDKFRRRT
jgi:hypothetical protein